MPFVLIVHEVEAYPAWKVAFDRAAGLRKAAGEISFQVLAYEGDANSIVHFSRWTSLPAARQFFESAEVAEIRREAGVKTPQFIYLDELDSGVL